MSTMMYILRHMEHLTSICVPKPAQLSTTKLCRRTWSSDDKPEEKGISSRMADFKKKLQEIPFPGKSNDGKQVTPIKNLDQKTLKQPKQFEYPAWPNNTNPHTGEIGGPKGPEPTRYGDWERKGRCSDF